MQLLQNGLSHFGQQTGSQARHVHIEQVNTNCLFWFNIGNIVFKNLGFFLSLSIAFVVPILGALLGFELMCITYVFIFTPLMIFSIFLYFRFHHEEIMNNEEYQNFKNRKRIIKTTLVISTLACAPLMLLLTLILNNL